MSLPFLNCLAAFILLVMLPAQFPIYLLTWSFMLVRSVRQIPFIVCNLVVFTIVAACGVWYLRSFEKLAPDGTVDAKKNASEDVHSGLVVGHILTLFVFFGRGDEWRLVCGGIALLLYLVGLIIIHKNSIRKIPSNQPLNPDANSAG